MDKKLLIGLGIGLVAYYFLMKKGKGGCGCQDAKTEVVAEETPAE